MRNIFIPLSKVLGLYVIYFGLVYALSMLPYLAALFSQSDDSVMSQTMAPIFGTSVTLTGTSYASVILLTIIVAWILIAKTGWLADRVGLPPSDSATPVQASTAVQAGIMLIGLYTIVQSIPALAQALSYVRHSSFHAFTWSMIAPPVLRLAIGLWLVRKPTFILELTGHGAGTDDVSCR